MALFDPFQTASLSLLDSVTESALCLGRANVARLDGNSWLGDNTLGSAIINCISPLLTSPVPPENADAGGQPAIDRPCILVVGARNIAKAMRLANTELASRIVVVTEGLVAHGTETVNEMWELTSLDAFAQLEMKIDCLVLDSLPNAAITRQLGSLAWSNSASCMMVGSASEKQLRLWKDSLKVTGLTRIEPVELMTHQAAADFFFWTGVQPSVDLIRDSLEEYMQW